MYYYLNILHLIVISENWENLSELRNKEAVIFIFKNTSVYYFTGIRNN